MPSIKVDIPFVNPLVSWEPAVVGYFWYSYYKLH